MKVLG
ncbi:unnamed protein product [Lathyrus oleraceus]|jgi:hypothetical protein